MIWCRNPRTSPVRSNFSRFLASNFQLKRLSDPKRPSLQSTGKLWRNVYLFSVAKIQILEDLNCQFSKFRSEISVFPDKSKTVRDLASKPYGPGRHSGRRGPAWGIGGGGVLNAICHQRPDLSSGVTGMRLAPVPGKMGKITETHQEAWPAVIIHHSSSSSFIVHRSFVHHSSFIIHHS